MHDNGRLLRAVDNPLGPRRNLNIADCSWPGELAQRLFATSEWARVHAINKRHLAQVARQAQATPRRDLTHDGYYLLVYRLVWTGSNGRVRTPPHAGKWNGWAHTGVIQFVNRLPAASLVSGAVDQGTVSIGLSLEFRRGLISNPG